MSSSSHGNDVASAKRPRSRRRTARPVFIVPRRSRRPRGSSGGALSAAARFS